MSKNNENKLVPRLRFPEFKNDGNWKEKLFRQLFEFGNGKDYKHLSNGDIPVYGTGGKMLSVNDYLYDGESVCIGRKGTIDSPIFLTGKFWTVDTLFYTHSFVNCIPKFIYYVFQNINWYDYNEAGGVPSLSKTTISKIKVLIPPRIEEQQKIAACLSSLDDVITAESKKLEVLKEHKKGLLQNLFPQEGETVPKLRFKEFEDSGEWVSDILKNVFTIFQGFAFSSNDSVNDGVRWLKIADVGIQQMNHLSPSYLPYEFKDKYENFLVKEGDYVIALTRPILNKKLKISKVDNTLHNSLLNQRVGKLVSNKCIDFVYYLVQTSNLISRIEQNIAGSEPPNLSAQQIENIEVFIPPTKKEQQKIANTLSSIDDLINSQSQKIETLKLHKKGLLQGLFPDVNEHNG